MLPSVDLVKDPFMPGHARFNFLFGKCADGGGQEDEHPMLSLLAT